MFPAFQWPSHDFQLSDELAKFASVMLSFDVMKNYYGLFCNLLGISISRSVRGVGRVKEIESLYNFQELFLSRWYVISISPNTHVSVNELVRACQHLINSGLRIGWVINTIDHEEFPYCHK